MFFYVKKNIFIVWPKKRYTFSILAKSWLHIYFNWIGGKRSIDSICIHFNLLFRQTKPIKLAVYNCVSFVLGLPLAFFPIRIEYERSIQTHISFLMFKSLDEYVLIQKILNLLQWKWMYKRRNDWMLYPFEFLFMFKFIVWSEMRWNSLSFEYIFCSTFYILFSATQFTCVG